MIHVKQTPWDRTDIFSWLQNTTLTFPITLYTHYLSLVLNVIPVSILKWICINSDPFRATHFTPCPLALSLNLTYTLLILLPLFWVIPNYRDPLTSHVPNVMPILCCIDRCKRTVRGRGFLKKLETCSFDSDKLLACLPTPSMEEHHLFALRGYIFNVFLFTLHYMKGLSFTCKQRARLPFVTKAQITAIITSTIKVEQKHWKPNVTNILLSNYIWCSLLIMGR